MPDAGVANCTPCWIIACVMSCLSVFQMLGQSWIRATGKSAGSLQLAVHQGEKHCQHAVSARRPFQTLLLWTLVASWNHHDRGAAADWLTQRDRPGPNDDE